MVCLSDKLIWLPHISFDCFVIGRSNCEEHSNYSCRKVHHSIRNRTSYHTRSSYEYRLVTAKRNIRFKLFGFAGSFDQLKVLTPFSHFFIYAISCACLLEDSKADINLINILYRFIIFYEFFIFKRYIDIVHV